MEKTCFLLFFFGFGSSIFFHFPKKTIKKRWPKKRLKNDEKTIKKRLEVVGER